MSSFVASQSDNDPADVSQITNNGFWPSIDISAFRQDERLAGDIPWPRLRHALTAALADVNRQLAPFQCEMVARAVILAQDIPRESWQTKDHYPALYRRAVYGLAHADLFERYRDHSATPAGDNRGEMRDAAADDHRRSARWAVAEILGQTHSTVELI